MQDAPRGFDALWHRRVCDAAAEGAMKRLRKLLSTGNNTALTVVSKQHQAPPLGVAVLHGQLEAGRLLLPISSEQEVHSF